MKVEVVMNLNVTKAKEEQGHKPDCTEETNDENGEEKVHVEK